MAYEKRPRVVIIGAGFGGLWAARNLVDSPVEIVLVDRHNFHTFLPLLYQVAAAELETGDIVYPTRSILRAIPNSRFVMAEVKRIDFARRQVEIDDYAIGYDYLVLATGSTSHYFGIPGAAENSIPLKILEHGVVLRNHILYLFERASAEPNASMRKRLLTFTIVGGGATGVEFAGALAELVNGPLLRDYPALDFREVQLVLVEAADTLLPHMAEKLQDYALSRLQSMGVSVRLRTMVSEVTNEAVLLKGGDIIPTGTVVWTAGVRGDPLAEKWGLPLARSKRVDVLPTLQVLDHPNIYVVGDLAGFEEDGQPLPMVAPVAIQQGVAAAQNIARQVIGDDPVAFTYKDRGTMVTIGRNAAVASVGGRNFTGWFAWILWLAVHLFNLIGFRNRLLVMINWAWDYFLFERAVRFIFPSSISPHIKAIRKLSQREAGEPGTED